MFKCSQGLKLFAKLAPLTSIIYIKIYMYGCIQSFFVLFQSSALLSSVPMLGQSS